MRAEAGDAEKGGEELSYTERPEEGTAGPGRWQRRSETPSSMAAWGLFKVPASGSIKPPFERIVPLRLDQPTVRHADILFSPPERPLLKETQAFGDHFHHKEGKLRKIAIPKIRKIKA